MRVFLGIVGRGSSLEPNLLQRIPAIAATTLPYRSHPARREEWRSATGRLAIMAWDNTAEADSPLIDVSQDGVHASVIGGAVGVGPGGSTALLHADADAGTLRATTSLTRLVPIFWAHTGRAWLVSTRAALLARLLSGGLPRYDLAGVVPLVLDGFVRSDRTVFEGVDILPPAAELTLSSDAASLHVPHPRELACGTLDPTSEDVDALAALLGSAVSPVAGRNVRLSLTGGRDSRLVAAAMRASGIQFHAQTRGFPSHPDVIVASQVAAALGVPHEVRTPEVTEQAGRTVMQVDIAGRARRVLFGADGMLHAMANKGSPIPAPDAGSYSINGTGGESLRGGYAKQVTHDGIATWDAAIANLTWASSRFDSLFRAGVARDYASTIQHWIGDDQAAGVAPAVSLDRYYVHYRTGRWASASRAGDIWGRGLAPLFDDAVTRFGLRLTPEAKAGESLVETLIARMAPELAGIPFAGKGGTGHDGPAHVGPAPVAPKQGVFDWRRVFDGDMYRAFRQRLLERGRGDPLFELVDRKAVERFCERGHGPGEQNRGRAYVWWGLYTASVLLSNEWLEPDAGPSQVVAVEVPAGSLDESG